MRARISASFMPWLRERRPSLVCGILLLGAVVAAPTAQDSRSPDWIRVPADLGLVDVQTICPDILVELKYATEDNFLHKNVYGDMKRCFLLKEAALKLAVAQNNLATLKPGWRLKIYDGARPKRVQAVMWALVKGTPRQLFVANPKTGSNHNYGAAVDLTLVDEKSLELDMGTAFDFFGDLAQPRLEDAFFKNGMLTADQVQNRRLLRKVMTEAGFIPISSEWWHFDAFPTDEVRKRFKIIE
ncbi:MAG: M15 family metallopeptidase [Candidatus Aminicenantales bacterium]